jgi:ELWxxDGT repeat protein
MYRSRLFPFLAVMAIASFFAAAQQNPKLLKDINPGTGGSAVYLNPFAADVLNSYLYFAATDGVHGKELWKTDGTTAGTMLVRDINAGSADGMGSNIRYCNGKLYLEANNGATGLEPYWSDGSTNQPVLVKNIFADKGKSIENSSPSGFTLMNGIVYFTAAGSKARIPAGGTGMYAPDMELYRTNGTAAGTSIVKVLEPNELYGTWPADYVAWNNVLYFTGRVSGYGISRLARSDGSANGTYMVSSAITHTADTYGRRKQIINNALYIVATDTVHGYELWKSDGTAAGTVLVKDINPSGDGAPRFITDWNGTLFFNADDGSHGRELWKSDGTTAGTSMVKDIRAGSSGSDPSWLTVFNNALYFMAAGDDGTRQLWKSDGTEAGTALLAVLNPTGNGDSLYFAIGGDWYGSGYYDNAHFQIVGNYFYFHAIDGVHGLELWRSDGTAAGTSMIKDINPGSGGCDIRSLRAVSGKLLYTVTLPAHGNEIWVYDPAQPISKEIAVSVPSDFGLRQNYPNPFSSLTTVTIDIPGDGIVSLRVFDLLGREVAVLTDAWQAAGTRTFTWNAEGLPTGSYICRLDAGGYSLTKLMTLGK